MNQRVLEFEQLVSHAGWLKRMAGALVRDADVGADVAQEALIAGWQHPPVAGSARGWLRRVIKNQVLDRRRGERRRVAREQAAHALAAPLVPTPERLVGDLEIHRAVAACLTALDEPYRTCLVLRYYEGQTAAEIARSLDVPAGTIRWPLKEGLERLRRALDQRCGDRRRWALALAPMVPVPPVRPKVGRGGWMGACAAGAALMLVGWWAGLFAKAPGGIGAREKEGAEVARAASGLAGGQHGQLPPPRFSTSADDSEAEGQGAGPDDVATFDPEALVRYMLAAIAADSYDRFLTYAADVLKARLQKDALAQVTADLGARLRLGRFSLEPFGTLRRGEHLVHLWKLDLRDGGDDVLVSMTLSSEGVTGFFLT